MRSLLSNRPSIFRDHREAGVFEEDGSAFPSSLLSRTFVSSFYTFRLLLRPVVFHLKWTGRVTPRVTSADMLIWKWWVFSWHFSNMPRYGSYNISYVDIWEAFLSGAASITSSSFFFLIVTFRAALVVMETHLMSTSYSVGTFFPPWLTTKTQCGSSKRTNKT